MTYLIHRVNTLDSRNKTRASVSRGGEEVAGKLGYEYLGWEHDWSLE